MTFAQSSVAGKLQRCCSSLHSPLVQRAGFADHR